MRAFLLAIILISCGGSREPIPSAPLKCGEKLVLVNNRVILTTEMEPGYIPKKYKVYDSNLKQVAELRECR